MAVLKVTVAKNGEQAVEYFESNSPGTTDAILMDVMKCAVMDGIRGNKSHTCYGQGGCKNSSDLFAMTANAFEEDARRCLTPAGMTASGKTIPNEDVGKGHCKCCGK